MYSVKLFFPLFFFFENLTSWYAILVIIPGEITAISRCGCREDAWLTTLGGFVGDLFCSVRQFL